MPEPEPRVLTRVIDHLVRRMNTTSGNPRWWVFFERNGSPLKTADDAQVGHYIDSDDLLGVPVLIHLDVKGDIIRVVTVEAQQQAARDFIDHVVASSEAQDAEHQHVALIYDPVADTYQSLGPFPDEVTAMLEAEKSCAEINGGLGSDGLDGPKVVAKVALHHDTRKA